MLKGQRLKNTKEFKEQVEQAQFTLKPKQLEFAVRAYICTDECFTNLTKEILFSFFLSFILSLASSDFSFWMLQYTHFLEDLYVCVKY